MNPPAPKRWPIGFTADVLRAARDDLDVTQEELGRRMGWSKKQMWDLEHGRKTVTVAHFFMVSRRLGIDPERLVRRVKNY